jgi:hypothetical protein
MGDVWDVVSSVQDAADAARDAQRRKKIGFWRAAVAIVGVFWTAAGILPGIPAMMSINRWMKGKSSRPLVAMVMGLVTLALLAALLVVGLFVLLFGEDPPNTAVTVGRTGLAALAAGATLWFVGRYLFARTSVAQQPVPSTSEQVGAAAGGAPGTAAPVVTHDSGDTAATDPHPTAPAGRQS